MLEKLFNLHFLVIVYITKEVKKFHFFLYLNKLLHICCSDLFEVMKVNKDFQFQINNYSLFTKRFLLFMRMTQ